MTRAYRLDPKKKRPANNVLALAKVMKIERLAYAGRSMRDIALHVGCSRNAVRRYFPRDATCPCGKLLVEHKGWCKVRYQQSGLRQVVFPPNKLR